MKFTLCTSLVAVALASTAAAQHPYGFAYHAISGSGVNSPTIYNGTSGTGAMSAVSYTHRATLVGAEGEVLNRYDADDYPEWGINANGDHESQGLVLVVQDQDISTVESFVVVGRNEDPAAPDFPDASAVIYETGPIQMPTGRPAGIEGYVWTITLASPVTTTANTDLFYGVRLPANTNWPSDGLSTWEITDDSMATTNDQPGRDGQPGAGIALDSYVCGLLTPSGVAAGPANYTSSLEQNIFDVIVNTPGGVPLTRTNQASLPTSGGTFVGTTNMLSGSHPDVIDFNGTGRQDDLGFVYQDPRTAGNPVFALFGFGPNPFGSQPITTFPSVPAGSTGTVCLDFTTADYSLNFAIADTNGVAVFNLPLGPTGSAARAFVAAQTAGVDLYWQGLGVESLTGGAIAIHASGCTVVHN